MFLKEEGKGKQAIRRSMSSSESRIYNNTVTSSSVSTSTGADERFPKQTASAWVISDAQLSQVRLDLSRVS